MTKAELVTKIANETGLTKLLAERRWTVLFPLFPAPWKAVRMLLSWALALSVSGKGPGAMGAIRGPEKKIEIPASKVVKFKAGKNLSEKVQ